VRPEELEEFLVRDVASGVCTLHEVDEADVADDGLGLPGA
jgi:hypothetical protein